MKINQNEPASTVFGTAFSVKTLLALVATVLMGAAVIYTGIQLSSQSKTATIQSRAAENSCVPAEATFYVGPVAINTPTRGASPTRTRTPTRGASPTRTRTPTRGASTTRTRNQTRGAGPTRTITK